MSISDRLDQIEARADAATESEWRTSMDWADGDWHIESVPDGEMIGTCPECGARAGFECADAEFIAAARTDVTRLVRALQAVLDLHKPYPDEGMGWRDDNTYGYVGTVCCSCGTPDEYGVPWPCQTVRAITTALGEEA